MDADRDVQTLIRGSLVLLTKMMGILATSYSIGIGRFSYSYGLWRYEILCVMAFTNILRKFIWNI